MSDERESGLSWGTVALVVLLLIVLYVLSIGPAAVIAQRTGGGAWRVFRVVYAPLIWLYENTPLREPLEHYVGFWFEITNTPIEPP